MDVKELQGVDDYGLEQWKPVLKAEFPLAADEVRRVGEALGVEVSPGRDAYSLEALLDEVVGPSPALTAVGVHKLRRHYSVAGAMAERSEVRAEGREIGTIAVESEDPARVPAALRELGLEGRPNVSFPRGLKALLGLGARRFAVIDVGTNSVKFHIGERSPDGAWRTIVDRAEVTGWARASTRRAARRGADGAHGDGDRGHGRRGQTRRRGGDRRGRDGRAAQRVQQRGVRRGRPRAGGRGDRGHPRRRGSAAHVPRGDVVAGRRRRLARRLRHGRRQHGVHLRRRETASTTSSA